jgi:polyphosphate kinase
MRRERDNSITNDCLDNAAESSARHGTAKKAGYARVGKRKQKKNPPMVPSHFLNRELGYLAFNERVLDLVEDDSVPLLERLRFLSIADSNMDEFFEIRVAGLKEQIYYDSTQPSADGLTPRESLTRVSERAHALITRMYELLNTVILPGLTAQNIHFLRRADWTPSQRDWIADYFAREVQPVLTPIGLDPAHPFPRLLNKSLNFAIELSGKDAFGRNSGIAVLQAPRALPRVIRLPQGIGAGDSSFVFLSSILHEYVSELFAGMTVNGWYQFQVTRNSELDLEEEDIKNLRLTLQGELPQRQFGDEVRLEVAESCSSAMAEFLLQQFSLSQEDLYRVDGPVNLTRLMQVPDWVERPDLKFSPFVQGLPRSLQKEQDLFKVIRKGDILLHHPYQSFKPVVDFIQQACIDPNVLAIKQTVYRAGTASDLIEALIAAALRGKEVTVVVELLARFDEEANINWAGRLEEAGAHVTYGVFGYKTHAKMSLVVRREEGQLRRYVHLGTGNYHARTTKLYTDFGLLTCNDDICADVNQVFLQLTGLGKAKKLSLLWQSPFDLHDQVIAAIERETKHAREGLPARIVAKMNQLTEPKVISALYAASQAGVKIDLLVRGVCMLRPQVPGLSENIRVLSVLGRFLEHSRVFYFRNGRHYDVYISSADWMERNFFRRIEVAVPIVDPKLKKRVLQEALHAYMRDNCQVWEMGSDGVYCRKQRRRKRLSAQDTLLAELAN